MRPNKIHNPGDMAPCLWDDFLVHELDEVMRQKDKCFAEALNRIWKKVPEKDSPDDMMLKSRELHIPHTDDQYPKNAMHVYAQNVHCSHWNSVRLDDINGIL